MTNRAKTAIVLLSGGLDSSLALALSQKEGWEIDVALTFHYGQKAAEREVAKSKSIAEHFGVRHRTIELNWFKELRHSSLMSDQSLPHPSVKDLSDKSYTQASAQSVWVPNRNGVFIEIAASFADEYEVSDIIVGFNREEAETFPDNSLGYLAAVSNSLSFSTRNQVKVISPTAGLDKSQIVQKAKAIGFPLSLLWSCYEAHEQMCGSCESCMRLKLAFSNNHVPIEGLFENTLLT